MFEMVLEISKTNGKAAGLKQFIITTTTTKCVRIVVKNERY